MDEEATEGHSTMVEDERELLEEGAALLRKTILKFDNHGVCAN